MFVPFWPRVAHPAGFDLLSGEAPKGRRPSELIAFRTRPPLQGSDLHVEFVELPGAQAVRDEWRDLLGRALEPNVFLDPAFALPAAQHLAERQRPLFALVRDAALDGDRKLLAIWPIDRRPAFGQPGLVRSWRTEYAALGMPLIDRLRANEVVDAMCAAVAARFGARASLLVPFLLRSGPTYGLLVTRAMATGRHWGVLSPHARAVLRAGANGSPGGLTSKRRKEFARQRRRLEERGRLQMHSASTAEEIREAAEQFLVLEARGWKGHRGTALLSNPGSAAFLRCMTRLLASEGRCRIDCLELDGRPIAMGIVLRAGDRAYFWKTAFDEAFAAYSPGVLLTLALTDVQVRDPAVDVTDSCAIAGHSMIERLWPERHDIADLVFAVDRNTPRAARSVLARERLRRTLRERAKHLVHGAARRVRSVSALMMRKGRPTSSA